MEINIINKFENKLLNRDEYEFYVDFQGPTPTRLQVRDKLSALINSNPKLTIIKKIFNRAGMQRVLCRAHVYKDEETMKKIEPKYILERHAKKEVGSEDKDKGSEEGTPETKPETSETPAPKS